VAGASPVPRIADIVEAIQHIRSEKVDVPLDAFETDWRKLWLGERGVEIISEAVNLGMLILAAASAAIPDNFRIRRSKSGRLRSASFLSRGSAPQRRTRLASACARVPAALSHIPVKRR
jgi:hypothetical protein